ncbi:hypothetical protein Hdeb2414_s0013g00409431 [Helianthus debilis subsp. tardiflorus]
MKDLALFVYYVSISVCICFSYSFKCCSHLPLAASHGMTCPSCKLVSSPVVHSMGL